MKKRTILIAIVLVLLVGGTVWAYRSHRSAAVVAEMKEKQKELFDQNARNTPPAQRQEQWREFREQMERLTPEQQHQVREGFRENMERHMNERIAGYFALPPAQRVAYLDKQIQEEEKRRKEWEARRAQAQKDRPSNAKGPNAATGGGGPPNRGPNVGGGSPNRGPNAGGGGPGRGRFATAEARALRRNQRLDRSTPEQRAQRNAYFSAMQQRRVQLGLPANPPHGPRGR